MGGINIKYIILGLFQGFTEPLPISSSGHIVLLKKIINIDVFYNNYLEIFLNFGSFLAILFLYRKKLRSIFNSFFHYLKYKDNNSYLNYKIFICVFIGTLPVCIVGILFKNIIESFFNNYFFLGIFFLITGLMLLIISFIDGNKDFKDLNYFDCLIIGLFQAIALLPGISRSGMTLVGCFLCRLNHKCSIDYTFLLYFPVSLLCFIVSIKDIYNIGLLFNINFFISMLCSFISTLISYNFLVNIVQRGKLYIFSIYLFILSIFVFIFTLNIF